MSRIFWKITAVAEEFYEYELHCVANSDVAKKV